VNARFKRLLLLSFVTLVILLLFLRLLVFTQHGVRHSGAEFHPSSVEIASGSASPMRAVGLRLSPTIRRFAPRVRFQPKSQIARDCCAMRIAKR
jgi:hypothetical protein